jgi:hypothetical protein
MNMQILFYFIFYFYQKQKLGPSVCKCVSHTPKLKLHIVPNVCISWKDLTREMEKLFGISLTQSLPPKLELKHTCSVVPHMVLVRTSVKRMVCSSETK